MIRRVNPRAIGSPNILPAGQKRGTPALLQKTPVSFSSADSPRTTPLGRAYFRTPSDLVNRYLKEIGYLVDLNRSGSASMPAPEFLTYAEELKFPGNSRNPEKLYLLGYGAILIRDDPWSLIKRFFVTYFRETVRTGKPPDHAPSGAKFLQALCQNHEWLNEHFGFDSIGHLLRISSFDLDYFSPLTLRTLLLTVVQWSTADFLQGQGIFNKYRVPSVVNGEGRFKTPRERMQVLVRFGLQERPDSDLYRFCEALASSECDFNPYRVFVLKKNPRSWHPHNYVRRMKEYLLTKLQAGAGEFAFASTREKRDLRVLSTEIPPPTEVFFETWERRAAWYSAHGLNPCLEYFGAFLADLGFELEREWFTAIQFLHLFRSLREDDRVREFSRLKALIEPWNKRAKEKAGPFAVPT